MFSAETKVLYNLKSFLHVFKLKYIMLNWIRIKNLALVEEADIEFGEKFNVITGETGAGKSVIIGTISMLLGGRADKSAIRTGTDRCEICAGITLKSALIESIKEILDKAGIVLPDETPQLQIKRIITSSSSRNFINDTPVTLQTLSEIGDFLIDVHGPNEHQSILRQSVQLELLDKYAHLEEQKNKCAELCVKIREVQERRANLEKSLPSAVEAEHLRLVVSEIEKTDPKPDEDKELSAKHALAANSREVIEISSRTLNMLEESETSVSSIIAEIYKDLQSLEKINPAKTAVLIEQCNSISEFVHGLASDLGDFTRNIDLDEKEFQELEERLSQLQTLKRRYGPYLNDVFASLEKAQARLVDYENSEDIRNSLVKEEETLNTDLLALCRKLSEQRKKISLKFNKVVTQELNKLGFLKCEFEVAFSETAPGPKGFDKIDFLFSANPGEAVQPLRNIASSGEISRVMLALKTVLAEADSVPILVFDEIDMNIGGETATTVGSELKKLAETHQVLCISHLAQVASQAELHYLVEKAVKSGRTSTDVKLLSSQKRTEEIARMLGGGKAALSHAKSLLNHKNS